MPRRVFWRAWLLAAALFAMSDGGGALASEAREASVVRQNNGWRLAGIVRDADGKPIRGAAVVAENQTATPPTQTRTTDDKGRFGLIALRTGRWTVTVTAPGYLPSRLALMVTRQSPRAPMIVHLERESAAPALGGIDARQLQSRLAAAAAAADKGDTREAIAIYDAIAARIPALTSVQLEIGRLSEAIGDRDRAIAAYEAIVRRAPSHADATAAKAALARLQR